MDDIENKFMRLTAKPSMKYSEGLGSRNTVNSTSNGMYDERTD